jgi:hypothetical protein
MQSDLGESNFNQALDAWMASTHQPGKATPESCWNFTLNAIKGIVPTAFLPLLMLQLSTRQKSARLEAFNQLAQQSVPAEMQRSHCCIAFLDGEVISNAKDMSTALRYTPPLPKTVPFPHRASLFLPSDIDHIYRRSNTTVTGARLRIAILYGPPGTECFQRMHGAITTTLDTFAIHDVDYVIRPAMLPECLPEDVEVVSSSTCLRIGSMSRPALSGYGVQLVLKDTEYSQVRSNMQL